MAAEKTGFLNFFKKRVHTSEINNITADFFNENLDTINNELETQAHKLFNKKLSNLTDGEHSLASEKVFAIHLHPHTQKKQDELFKRKLGTSKVIQKGDYFYKASTISPPEGNSQGQKLAGLLDAPKDTLPWDLWSDINGTYKLRPPIKNYILSKLYDVVPKTLVAKVYIIGSSTGYKYRDTSDIDVNVYLRADVSKEEVKTYHVKMRTYNETLAPGTKHPVNFYISYYVSDKPFLYSAYGVYSVLDDRWVKDPPPRESIRDPQLEFAKEIATAKIFKRNFARLSDEYNKDLLDFAQLPTGRARRSKQVELDADLKALQEAEKSMHADRELVYGEGWGVPRRSFRNILYKLVEHGQYGEILKRLKSYRHSEKP